MVLVKKNQRTSLLTKLFLATCGTNSLLIEYGFGGRFFPLGFMKMKKKKDLEKELKKYNISFEKEDGIYYLWCGREFPHTKDEAWRVVNSYVNDQSKAKKLLKKFSNKKERTRLRQHLKNNRFEFAEIRDNKENPLVWR